LKKLYNACHFGDADLAIGSRYVTGVNVVNWPLSRVLLSYLLQYMCVITGMKIHDATAGFICLKIEEINLDKIRFVGYAFQIEMKYRTAKKISNVEVPIIFTDRTKGNLK
jgi:dolichol-phosphate mannosyltransferase